MDEYTITAHYELPDSLVYLGKFKTEDKAWSAISKAKLDTCQNPEQQQYFDDHCYILLTRLTKE